MLFRPRLLGVPLAAVLLAGLAVPAGALTDPATGDLDTEAPATPGRIVISWDPAASASDRAEVLARHGLRSEEVYDFIDVEVVGLAAWRVPAALDDLTGEAAVRLAEPDVIAEATDVTEPDFWRLWGLHNTGQAGGTVDVDVDAPEAWAITRGSADVVVAVVDTGIDITHPDLADNIWVNVDEIPGNGLDDDGNGKIDDVNGWDFRNDDASVFDSASEDDHGTHVAGTIAGVSNGAGIVGLAPNVKIMPIKFLGGAEGTGSTAAAAAGIDYAVRNGATVINASFGGGSSATLQATIARIDALVVASAGNNGVDIDLSPSFPASLARDSYGLPHVVSVASVDRTGARSTFSNHGVQSVDLGAPGSQIYSSLPGGAYGTYSGTSMAAPHVSATAALVASLAPTLTGAQLATAIKDSAQPLASMAGLTTTGGLLNAHAALLRHVTPAVPIDVTAVAANGRATVQWTPGSGGGTPASYTVSVAPTGGVTGATARTVAGPATSTVFDGLTNDTAYAFTVSATNAGGTSAASAPSPPVTPEVTVPGVATAVTATGGDGYVDLTWTAPADDGGTPLTGYTVQVSPDTGVAGELERTVAASVTSLRFDGLTNGTLYGFAVVASNTLGDGAASTPVTATPQVPPPPPAPSGGGGGGGGGGFAPAPAPAPAAPAPAPTEPVEPTEPVALPYDGNGSRSLAWACPVVPASTFADVPVDSPHAAGVGCASAWQVFTGSTTGAFQPGVQLSRGQLASVLARGIEQALGEELPTGRDRFRDDDGSVHKAAIDKLAELGIVGGVSADRYAPGAPVTRAQFAAMLARTYRELAGELPVGRDLFADDEGSSHESAINSLAAIGVVAGTGQGVYSPGAVLNRGQAATMVARLLDALVESGAVAPR